MSAPRIKEWNGRARWVAPVGGQTEVQASLSAFHDWRTRGTDFSANRTNGADASVRLIGRGPWQWSALGYWQRRNLQSSFASLSPGRITATRVSLQDYVPSQGIGGSVEVRPPMPADLELRLGIDARRTDGETREYFSYVAGEPTRRRRAGGNSGPRAFAETTADLGCVMLTGGARLDHWSIGDGHLFERRSQAAACCAMIALRTATAGCRPRGPARELRSATGFSLRSAAYLGWRLPTLNELFRPFRAGPDATAANPDLDPERLAGAEAGAEYARGRLRLTSRGSSTG